MKKLLLLSAFLIFACTDDEGNPCVYQPTLTTETVTDITETLATLNGTIDIYSQNCDTVENILQGFVYSTSSEPTINDDIVNVNGTSITESLTNLEPNTTYYVRVFLVRPLIGVFYGNEVSFVTEDSIDDCDVVYLDNNGVTIKAYPCAEIGDVGTINGVEYTVVDRAMLDQMVGYEASLNGDGFPNGFPDVTKLCTTRVTDMSYLFWDCVPVSMQFNQPIGNWDVSNVTTMERMFSPECGWAEKEFNQDISNWDVSNVTEMSRLFEDNPNFNQDISDWDVSNVTNMSYMFYNAQSYNQSILGWDTSNVTDMSYMFSEAYSFNQDSNNINTGSVTNCTSFCLNATSWTLPKPNFSNCGEIGCDIEPIDCDIVYLDNNGVTIKAYPCAEIGDVGTINGVEYTVVDRDMLNDIIGYDFDNNFYGPITADLTKICTSRITDMSMLIFGCGDDFNQPIGNWDVSNVTTMARMFNYECGLSQFNQDLSHWDVSNVINMEGMFGGSGSFEQDLNQWDVSNVTNMARMFVYSSFNQPINNWDVSNVINMQSMFYGNYQFNQDIIQWDVSNVTDMYAMFLQAYSFNQDLSNWPVENVTSCGAFSYDTPQWTLPQPNFTNCNPN